MSNPAPLVSVIVPLLEWNRYVQKTLASLAEQTYRHLDIVLVASEGVSVESPWPLHTVNSRKISDLLNEGLKLVKGDYITFLTSPDLYHPERVQRCVDRLLAEKAEFLFTKVQPLDPMGNALPWEDGFWRWKQCYEFNLDMETTIGFNLLRENVTVAVGNLFVSKKVAERVSFRDLFYYAYDFALRALLIAEPVFFKEELYFYRVLEGDKSYALALNDEIRTLHMDYLIQILQPPENKMAPCHHYWPIGFAHFRNQLKIDASFLQMLEELAPVPKPVAKIAEKKNYGRKISILVHDLSLTGIPRVAADLALALKREGFAPNIIAFKDGPLKAFFHTQGMPVSVIPFPFEKGRRLKTVCFFLALVWTVFRKCHKTTLGIGSLVWPAMLLNALTFPFRKLIWYVHDSFAPEAVIEESRYFKLFQRCLKKKNLRFWFGSNATRFIWQKAEVDGELLYWSGIPHNMQLRKPKELKKILSVGTGYPRKGAHFLVDAFITCVREKKIPADVTLKIVGFSDTLPHYTDFVSELAAKIRCAGLEKRISLLKEAPEELLETLYDESDLYVQPSFMECLPLTLLKAMSKAMPSITTDVDGCVEAIEDGVNGLICPPRNCQILAQKLAEAIHNPEKAQEMGRRAQESFNQRFAFEMTMPLILEALKRENGKPAYFTKYAHDTNKKFMPLRHPC